jgi:alpha-tubulin suppressor-like RCC1 family protein
MGRRALLCKVSIALGPVLALLGLLPGSTAAFADTQAGALITAGSYQTCAIETGQAYCWGPDGQLGDGSMAAFGLPVAVDTTGALAGKTLVQVSAGDGFACALDTSGQAYCWGANDRGELGDGNTVASTVPVAVDTSGVLAGKSLTQISAGQQHACALDTSGQAYCWGLNIYGALGDGATTDSSVPVAVDTSGVLAGKTLTKLAGGETSTCALDTSGAAYCWGDNDLGELGDGTTANSTVPVAVDLAGKVLTSITGGVDARTFCALDSTGSAYCWGFRNSDVPTPVGTDGALAGKTLTQISTSGFHTCALDTAGAAYCWGDNYYGELGDGTTVNSSVPVAVDTTGVLAGKVLTQISAGGDFWTCAADNTGAVYCWGNNGENALGDGRPGVQSHVPVQAGPSPPTNITATAGNRTAGVSWTAPAMPGDSVTGYTAFASPGGELCITAATTCTISGLTNQTTYSITVIAHTATINSHASAPVSVTPGSDVSFTSNPYYTAAFGAAFSFTVSASGSPLPKITRKGRLPSGVTFTRNDDGTATLAGTPNHAAAGQYPLTFTAKSTAGTATQVFTLTVTKAPALRKIPAATSAVNTALNLPLGATGYPVPSLTESGTLPYGVSLTDQGDGTGVISGTPAPGSGGRYLVTVTAASTSGTATRSFILKIDEAPAITSANSTTVTIGYIFSFPVITTGYPAPKVTESGTLPKGVTFKSSTATLHGIPRAGTSGSYPITITAQNAVGTITQDFTLTVTAPPSSTHDRGKQPPRPEHPHTQRQ